MRHEGPQRKENGQNGKDQERVSAYNKHIVVIQLLRRGVTMIMMLRAIRSDTVLPLFIGDTDMLFCLDSLVLGDRGESEPTRT